MCWKLAEIELNQLQHKFYPALRKLLFILNISETPMLLKGRNRFKIFFFFKRTILTKITIVGYILGCSAHEAFMLKIQISNDINCKHSIF